MDNKRKASASSRGGAVDGEDRAAKRRKMPSDFPYLSKRETHESTTAYGLSFLESIRKTADKYGRGVAGYFEKLLPKEGNEEYYRRIRMPVSLRVIERRLYRQEFANMSELESWFKRMVNNAKEFYPRGSQTYEDAERVRKATSNYMTRTNPAYKSQNYAATPAPIPPDWDVDAELRAEDLPSDLAAAEVQDSSQQEQQQQPEDEDAEGEDEEMPDAEGEADEDVEAEADEGEADEDVEAEVDEADADLSRGSNTRIVLKRRGARATETEDTPSTAGDKTDMQYSEVPYQGLTFQQTQEKIMDALMTRKDEDDDWPYFEPFMNLPPKSLKDYYQLIEEPISLKKLQNFIRGRRGRSSATGISEFKSWAALEEKASLLWTNTFYYNEEGSEISELAKELRDAFYEQLNEAKACVEEPPQPKIILRAPSAQAQATTGKPRRITIHVGGREGSQGSAEQAAQPADSAPAEAKAGTSQPASVNSSVVNPAQGTAVPPTPSAAVKREDSARQSPAVPPPVSNGYSSSAFRPVMPPPVNGYQGHPQPSSMPNGHAPVPQHPATLYDVKYRGASTGVSEAILTNLCIRTPLDNNPERRFVFNVPPHPKVMQQSFTINLAANQWKLHIIPRISPALEAQQRPYKLYVLVNGQTLARGIPNPRDPIQNGELLYDAQLHQGVNIIMVQMIAAMPKGQKLPNGSDAVLEKITVLANVIKQY